MNTHLRNGLVGTAIVAASFVGAGVVGAQADDTGTNTEITAGSGDDTGVHTRTDTDTDRAERRDERRERRAETAAALADLLGIDVDELRTALRDGATLADLATDNGVDPQTVVDARVAEITERVDAAVADGRLTADEAAEKLADLEERVTTRVNEGRPERGDRMRDDRHGPRGHNPAETTADTDG